MSVLPPTSSVTPIPADAEVDLFNLENYDYTLPPEQVAAYPLAERDASRMLLLDRHTGSYENRQFRDIIEFLNPGDLMVLNNTQVLPARFFGHREGYEGKVEILLLHPALATSQNEASPSTPLAASSLVWHCLMRPYKKLAVGTRILLHPPSYQPQVSSTPVVMEVVAREGEGHGHVAIHLNETCPSIETLFEHYGHMPIPPYFNRPDEAIDKERYQTVFAKVPGAQAAPTASLHFTPALLEAIRAKGVHIEEVTLSVGAGTFKPVTTEDIREHAMDAEAYVCPQQVVEAIQATKQRGNKVIAVGTTVMKTLETVAQAQGGLPTQAQQGWSHLFIYPGFHFQVVDVLLTNFHLPKSTLMMLVSAFSSRQYVLQAYHHAVEAGYRFYSYGDCMLMHT
ncbi:MAG: tRNA preQ1(34) S-adenosylmethionine ribosyltransferase-isomerase QueA [Vampirovibrionales bacterium]